MAEVQDLEAEASEIEAVEQLDAEKEQAAEVEAKPETPEDDIPDEFKGMSPSELARIAMHARKEMGRQGNELGEIRKLADDLIKSQLRKQPEEEKPKEVDFFENPQEAIRQAVETNPRVMEASQYALQAQQEMARQKLAQKHPDFAQVITDSDFAEWVKGSRIRMQLFNQADTKNDVEAADELLSTYKQLKASKPKPAVSEAEKQVRDSALKAAAVETGGSGEGSKKVYRRADLIRLKMRDPAKFDAMQTEIDAAYRDGRVK